MKYYNLAVSNTKADLYIFGDITSFPWFDSDVSSYSLVDELKALPENVTEISVHINSYGGEVAEGLAIYNTLKNESRKVTTYCDGFACSAASVVFMGGSTRIMYPSSLLMIHNAWTRTSGNANSLRKTADDLEVMNSAIREAYKGSTKIADDELQTLLDNETWLTAAKSLDYGFATMIQSEPETDTATASARKIIFNKVTASRNIDLPLSLPKGKAVTDEPLPPPKNEDDGSENETETNKSKNGKNGGSEPGGREPGENEPAGREPGENEPAGSEPGENELENETQNRKETNEMKNLDLLNAKNAASVGEMYEAVKTGNAENFAKSLSAYAESLQEEFLTEAKSLIGCHDVEVLASRGVRQLTSEENKYFSALENAFRSDNPKAALSELDVVFPKTEIDAIFDWLVEKHPLLNAIDFQNTSIITEFLTSSYGGVAVWGDLTDGIKGELNGTFAKVDLTLKKLTAFIPISNAMLDLEPVWLERWIRTIMADALAVQLEAGIVDGDGDNKPIGMTRKLTGAVDGVYQRKTRITVTSLDTVTYGKILETLSKAPNNKRRAITKVDLIVNPADYFTKVFPATTVRTTDGAWNSNTFPFPTTVHLSAAIPVGNAIFGLPKEYFMGIGNSKSGSGKLEYSDDVKFMDD